MIKLSIVILNFNTKRLTINCVNSIYKSKPRVGFEVVVVDNGSTDGTVEALRKLKFKNFRIIENKKNLGFSKGNNAGIRKATGKYILLLNSDTIVKEHSIDRLYEFAAETTGAGVVGARLLNKDGSVQKSVFRFPTVWRAVKEYWFGIKNAYTNYAPKTKKPTKVEAVVGAAFLITPQALKKVGLLDESYFMYFEDLDYCRRVKNSDLNVYYLPEAEIVHLHGQSGRKLITKDNQWRRLVEGSKRFNGYAKHYLLHLILWFGQKLRE